MLADLLADCTHPCVMDVKMGTRFYDDDATPTKREKMIQLCNSTTSMSTGIRISGIKRYDPVQNVFQVHDKEMGKSLTADTIHDGVALFLPISHDMLDSFIDQVVLKLKAIRAVVQEHNLRLYSTSLLFYYDYNTPIDSLMIKLIDFAHSHVQDNPIGQRDDGFLFGLESLVSTFLKLKSIHSL